MTSKTIKTCGKCDGQGSIAAFEHINEGRCFACGGTGEIELSERDEQQYDDPSKVVETSFGEASIWPFGKGFQAIMHDGSGCFWFEIANGRIVNLLASVGVLGQERQMIRDLQAAHDAWRRRKARA